MSVTSDEIVARLKATWNRPPSLDKRAVEAALRRHLESVGLAPLPVLLWCPDAVQGHLRAMRLLLNTTYTWIVDHHKVPIHQEAA